ncbi:type II toxin-antitoxin system PemK/MazF family toxin [Empedobacter brevis]|uniref:type II toxin-antitoxin system PemK/MazF family toxin n=1 Tax=Empedobacter brevis TaxID=247 RepID=UPI00123D7C02|nr:type II toxin-antitoxin system PemK/MazF family toxin [Empedobacter brevis]QES93113.1 type II toxin-antitoxin system PemK/MazF family toxin [Empedobacter brevis]
MKYNQRDIVLVKYPFTNLKESKVRPALIISNKKVNKSGDYIFVMITSQKLRENFLHITSDMIETPFRQKNGIEVENYLYCKKISTIDESLVVRKISELKSEYYDNVYNMVTDGLILEESLIEVEVPVLVKKSV